VSSDDVERRFHAREPTLGAIPRSFGVRGVVEGFYGTPWSHEARLDALTFLAPRGANAYVYAPKDDAKHRADWRVAYDPNELARFAELNACAVDNAVRFGFAISPGLDITYESADDRATLMHKLSPLRDAGIEWFLLLVDDIPMQRGLAPLQAALAAWLREQLAAPIFALCPTEYVGTRPSPYLNELGKELPPEIDVMWTGPTVCSPELRVGDALAWTDALSGHRIIAWDNYPVNDALMTRSLHLGPYVGRDGDLCEVLGGVLCNPMTQPYASMVPLATAMNFLADPDGYDADTSWERAIDDVGGERASALRVLAHACADSPIAAPDELDLAQRVDELEGELDGPGWIGAVAALADELKAARALPETFPAGGDPFASELAPWALGARIEAEAGLAALRLIQAARPIATVGDEVGRAAAPDPEPAMHAAFFVLYVWTSARADEKVVYGPRFAIYTPVIQMSDGAPALDAAAAVREDANAIDRLCRLALAMYDDWRTTSADQPLRVLVDGEERAIAADGTFDGRGTMALVRQGPLCTRVAAGQTLPFNEARLS
jgi:hyaluronoglucosaminidase